MFKTGDNSKVTREKEIAESNYILRKDDVFELEIYSNNGGKIIDPNSESYKDLPGMAGTRGETARYFIDKNGLAKLPIVREIKLEGLTVRQAEELLQKEYTTAEFQQTFVLLKVTNKRVTVLGSPGGKVIPLLDENVKLTEILALAGGISKEGKAGNIRVLRGDKVFLADLSTVEGYLRDDMLIQSGDIIYVEPVRRPFLEGLQNYGPLFSIIVSLVTLVVFTMNNQN